MAARQSPMAARSKNDKKAKPAKSHKKQPVSLFEARGGCGALRYWTDERLRAFVAGEGALRSSHVGGPRLVD
eukprot:5917330-Prymnesium_polylepis.1